MEETIRKAVIEAINVIQSNSGREITQLSGTTCPMRDLTGFDSLNAVEVSAHLSQALGFEVETNLLFAAGPSAPISIDEAVDRICKQMGPADQERIHQ